jgi:O-antigen polymerase
MKTIINLKHWQGIFFSLMFFTSFIISKQYTDPFFVPKNYFFFLTSGVFLFLLCIHYYNKKYDTKLSFSYLDISVLGLLLFLLIRLLLTPGVTLDNVKFYLFILSVVVYFLIKPFLFENSRNQKKYQIETIVNVLLIIAILQVLWGFLQYFQITPNLQKQFKVGGAFGNPGQYTNFLTPLLAFSLAVSLFSEKKNKVLGIIATIGILILLPLTQARTSWIGALIVILYLAEKKFSVLRKTYDVLKSTIVKITVVSIVVIGVILAGYFLYNLKHESSSGRVFIWEVSFQMIKDKPIQGHGFDRFASAHNSYQALYFKNNPHDNARKEIADGVNYAFNEFIQASVETGILSALLLLSIFYFAFKNRKNTQDQDESLYFYAAKGSIIVIFISMLFSYPLHTVPSLILLFFSLVVVDSLSSQEVWSISIKQKTRRTLALMGIVVISIFLIIQYNRNKAEYDWLAAYKLMRQNKQEDAYRIYQELYPKLKYNQFFLFNYGAELSLMQKYDESINILKEAEVRLNDADFSIYLGSSYENSGNLKEAENCFLEATYKMPMKFFPKYKLVNIYMKTGRKAEAVKLAKELLAMKVKIPSQTIDIIKEEMKKLVENNASDPIIKK